MEGHGQMVLYVHWACAKHLKLVGSHGCNWQEVQQKASKRCSEDLASFPSSSWPICRKLWVMLMASVLQEVNQEACKSLMASKSSRAGLDLVPMVLLTGCSEN